MLIIKFKFRCYSMKIIDAVCMLKLRLIFDWISSMLIFIEVCYRLVCVLERDASAALEMVYYYL